MRKASRRRPGGSEEGLAMVVALVIIMLVFLLISTAIAQALFDLSQSSVFRRRLEAINAAEAGVAWYSQLLYSASAATLTSAPWVLEGGRYVAVNPVTSGLAAGVTNDPNAPDPGAPAQFTVEVAYFVTDPCPTSATSRRLRCTVRATAFTGWGASLPDPIFAIVTSIGRSGDLTRAVEVPMRLHPLNTSAQGATRRVGAFCMAENSGLDVQGSQEMGVGGGGGWPVDAEYLGCPSSGVKIASSSSFHVAGMLKVTGAFEASFDGAVSSVDERVKVQALEAVSANIGSGSRSPNGYNCAGQNKKVQLIHATTKTGGLKVYAGACVENDPVSESNFTPTLAPLTSLSSSTEGWAAAGFTITSPPVSLPVSVKTAFVSDDVACTISTVPSGTYFLTQDVAVVSRCGISITSARFVGGGSLYIIVTDTDCGPSSTVTLSGVSADQGFYVSSPCTLRLTNGTDVELALAVGRLFVSGTGNRMRDPGDGLSIPGPVNSFSQDIRYVLELTAREVEALA